MSDNRAGHVLAGHLPAILYAALIFIVSSLPSLHPPDLGLSWDDKIYHFGEYYLFSITIFFALRNYRSPFTMRNIHWLAIMLAAVFAVTDELHQSWVPGRDATVADFAADTLGAAVAQATIWLVRRWRAGLHRRLS